MNFTFLKIVSFVLLFGLQISQPCLGQGIAFGEEKVLFKAGSWSEIYSNSFHKQKSGKVFRLLTSQRSQMRIPLPPGVCGEFDGVRIVFTASRAGDSYRLTMTTRPGIDDWKYYYSKFRQIKETGKNVEVFAFGDLASCRNPKGYGDIQSLELNFSGWGIKAKPGLEIQVEEIVLFQVPALAERRRVQELREQKAISQAREIVEQLPEEPWIPVPNVRNRDFWKGIAGYRFARQVIAKADQALLSMPQAPPNRFYLEFFRSGKRENYQKSLDTLRSHFENMTLAMCLTGNVSRYRRAWMCSLDNLLGMSTWVLPAHDPELENFTMKRPSIDLMSSEIAAVLSTSKLLLEPCLDVHLKKRIDDALRYHLTDLLSAVVKHKRKAEWWFTSNSNWNAVCISNCIIALLATNLPSAVKKEILVFCFSHLHHYLDGFTADGYCTEGISYWTYGFSRYMLLAAYIDVATSGRIRMLEPKRCRLIADFPRRFMLSPQNYPAFSDAQFNFEIHPATIFIKQWLLREKNFPKHSIPQAEYLKQLAILALDEQGKPEPIEHQQNAARISSFDLTGIYLFRNGERGLALACKGGSNHELHNHNDVGSYAIALPGYGTLLGDPGGTVYTKDTFSSKRYENPLLSSYGHPVPVINGILQTSGDKTEAQVLHKVFHDDVASVRFDIRKAYKNIEGIRRLERVFTMEYKGTGTIHIEDIAEFEKAYTFEVPIITYGKLSQLDDHHLQVQYQNQKILISVNTGHKTWHLRHEQLAARAQGPGKVQRYAIVMDGRHEKVRMKLTMELAANDRG